MSSRLHQIATVLLLATATGCAGPDPAVVLLPPPRCREPATPPAPFAGRADTLFKLVPESSLNATQAGFVAAAREQSWTARVVVGRIAPGADSLLQPGRAVTLVVSPTLAFVATGQTVEHRAAGEIFWTGTLAGQDGGSAILLTSLGVTGDVRSIPPGGPYSVYTFQPIGGGLHAISCIDPALIPID